MKRFHLALTVSDLERSTAFYTRLFGAEPVVREADYAKWIVEDPALNLSLSTHGSTHGVDHVGLEADSDEGLAELRDALVAAEGPLLDQPDVTCCYARSAKTWTHDPDGVAWETFRSYGRTAQYGDGSRDRARLAGASEQACC